MVHVPSVWFPLVARSPKKLMKKYQVATDFQKRLTAFIARTYGLHKNHSAHRENAWRLTPRTMNRAAPGY
jgi:hypothetical protein